ncbi:hypothetical protein Ddc_06565 [Ditylenchus destructor]|nr:hypothetical protein Ddc_06565 [Ditylenchus destructor]
MEPCMEIYGNSLMPCMESCESEASDIGADVDELKQCIHKLEPHFKTTMECVKNTHFDVCANETREDVPKRYPETIKMSADVEVKNTLSKPNVPYDVKKFLVTGRKLRQCVHSCIDRRTNECLQKSNCALDHPSDPKIVEQTRQCGLHNGFNAHLAREVCNCVRDSGVK